LQDVILLVFSKGDKLIQFNGFIFRKVLQISDPFIADTGYPKK
jgi:hypothetical protein